MKNGNTRKTQRNKGNVEKQGTKKILKFEKEVQRKEKQTCGKVGNFLQQVKQGPY